MILKFLKNKWTQWEAYKNAAKKQSKIKYYFLDFIETIIVAVSVAFFIKTYIVQVSVVPTGSMIPTLIGGRPGESNERLFVSKFSYDFSGPKRGEIVVFKSPHQDGKDYVKRCIGLPGETIEIRRGIVYINNKELILTGVDIQRDYTFYGPTVIPEDHYFVLGDNRAFSQDSRYWGGVPKNDFIGKAFFTWWPLSRVGWLK